MDNQYRVALSVEEAAEAAGISRTSIYVEIRSNRLVAHKIGKRTVIAIDDLKRWLDNLPKMEAH